MFNLNAKESLSSPGDGTFDLSFQNTGLARHQDHSPAIQKQSLGAAKRGITITKGAPGDAPGDMYLLESFHRVGLNTSSRSAGPNIDTFTRSESLPKAACNIFLTIFTNYACPLKLPEFCCISNPPKHRVIESATLTVSS